ncbi:uncharacterized protein LOC144445610 [Glandiceps talaboti]
MDDTRILEVTGFKPETSLDTLEMYFESKKWSGGGAIEDIKRTSHGSVKITYEKSEDTQRVLSRQNHTLDGQTLVVKQGHTKKEEITTEDNFEDGDDVANCTIEVHGFQDKVSIETLEMYFESKKRSGGGPIAETQKKSGDILMITYENSEDAERVLKRGRHVIGGNQLAVNVPAIEKTKPKTPQDKRSFLLKGLAEGTTTEKLELYLENRTNIDEEPKLLFSQDRGTVMVRYTDEITDFDDIIRRISQRTLDKATLVVEPVHHTQCIVVKDLPKTVSEETLELYFESWKRSGGGDVEKVEYDKVKNTAIVYFKNYKVIDSVLRRSHTISKTTVVVEPCYESLCTPCEPSTDRASPKIPQTLPVRVNSSTMKFIMAHEHFKEELNLTLMRSFAQVEWPHQDDEESATLTRCMTEEGESKDSDYENWAQTAESSLQEFLDRFKEVSISVPEEIFLQVTEKLQSSPKNNDVSWQADQSSLSINVIGEASCVDDMQVNINASIKRKTDCFQLESMKIKQLLLSGFTDQVMDKFPDVRVQLSSETDTVVLEGQADAIMEAKVMMYEHMNRMLVSRVKTLDSHVIDVLSSKEVTHKIDNVFKDESINAMYLVDDGDVICSSNNEADLERAIEVLKMQVVEKNMDIGTDLVSVFQMDEWRSISLKLQEDRLVRITLNSDQINTTLSVIGIKSSIDLVFAEIESFIKGNSIIEKTLVVEPGVMRYLYDHKNDAMQDTEDQAKRKPFHISKTQRSGSNEILVKGTKDDTDMALVHLNKLVTDVKCSPYTINTPGLSMIFTEGEGKTFLKSVEDEFKCTIEEKQNSGPGSATESSWNPYGMLTLLVHCEVQQNIDSAIESIDKYIKEAFVDKKVVNEDIKKLSFMDISTIQSSARPLHVRVDVEPDGSLRLQGTKMAVEKVNKEIQKLLSPDTKAEIQTSIVTTLIESSQSEEDQYKGQLLAQSEESKIDESSENKRGVSIDIRNQTVIDDDVKQTQPPNQHSVRSEGKASLSESRPSIVTRREAHHESKQHYTMSDSAVSDSYQKQHDQMKEDILVPKMSSSGKTKSKKIFFDQGMTDTNASGLSGFQNTLTSSDAYTRRSTPEGASVEVERKGNGLRMSRIIQQGNDEEETRLARSKRETKSYQQHPIQTASMGKRWWDEKESLRQKYTGYGIQKSSEMDLDTLTLKTPWGITVDICCGDMTRESVDVVVNSANEVLEHGGGLAGALVRVAGHGLQRESHQIVKSRQLKLAPSEVVHTGAYNLPCKYVLHAIGVAWKDNSPSQDILRKTVHNSLMYAENKLKASSIALPAVNTGVYGAPKNVCAEAMFDAIKEFGTSSRSPGSLKTIRVVDIDKTTIAVMQSTFQRELQQYQRPVGKKHTRKIRTVEQKQQRYKVSHLDDSD